MGRVLLVRHGETTWNRERRIQGWAPTDLTDRGREQAAALGTALADSYEIDRTVASDLRRTRETAERIHREVEADVRFDERWRERDFGVCQGFGYEEFLDRFPDLSVTHSGRDAVDAAPEGGETLRETYDRVVDAWEDARATTADGETTLVVSHGGPIALLLGHLKGLGPAEGILEHHQENCAINEIRVDGPAVVRENEVDAWRPRLADD